MKMSKFLKQVRDNMSPETWIKGSLCKGKDGKYANFMSVDVCSFCLYGYLYHTEYLLSEGTERLNMHIDEDLTELIIEANPQITQGRVTRYNDNPETTFEDIVKVVDNSIQYAEAKGL